MGTAFAVFLVAFFTPGKNWIVGRVLFAFLSERLVIIACTTNLNKSKLAS